MPVTETHGEGPTVRIRAWIDAQQPDPYTRQPPEN
jgi:hypothetical protein